MPRFQDKVCLINGAASQIGQAVASRFAGEGGAVVNGASFLADVGAATAQMGYAAAKAGVVQLTRDLGVHLARSGVRVNAVLFGPIGSPAQRAVFERNPGAVEKRLVH